MTDSYQPIYDAVRSKISGCDVSAVVRDVLAQGFDISWTVEAIKQEFISALHEYAAPHAILRAKVYKDGDMWCCLYGDNIMEGVVGFGATPRAAAVEFDKAWRGQA